jgi:hypothetical protein
MPNAIGTNAIDGPSFSAQLQQAGLQGLPFGYGTDGTFHYDPSMTSAQISQVQAVYSAHNPTQGALLDYANQAQWNHASSGYTATINGTPRLFLTDTADLPLINNTAHRLAEANPPANINWQFDPVTVVPISAADFTTSANKINDFIEATFTSLTSVIAQIKSGAITTNAQIDAVFNGIPNSGNVS